MSSSGKCVVASFLSAPSRHIQRDDRSWSGAVRDLFHHRPTWCGLHNTSVTNNLYFFNFCPSFSPSTLRLAQLGGRAEETSQVSRGNAVDGGERTLSDLHTWRSWGNHSSRVIKSALSSTGWTTIQPARRARPLSEDKEERCAEMSAEVRFGKGCCDLSVQNSTYNRNQT